MGQAKIWGQANFEAKSEARPGFRAYRIFIADSFSSGNNPFLVNRESSVVYACHLLCVEIKIKSIETYRSVKRHVYIVHTIIC